MGLAVLIGGISRMALNCLEAQPVPVHMTLL